MRNTTDDTSWLKLKLNRLWFLCDATGAFCWQIDWEKRPGRWVKGIHLGIGLNPGRFYFYVIEANSNNHASFGIHCYFPHPSFNDDWNPSTGWSFRINRWDQNLEIKST